MSQFTSIVQAQLAESVSDQFRSLHSTSFFPRNLHRLRQVSARDPHRQEAGSSKRGPARCLMWFRPPVPHGSGGLRGLRSGDIPGQPHPVVWGDQNQGLTSFGGSPQLGACLLVWESRFLGKWRLHNTQVSNHPHLRPIRKERVLNFKNLANACKGYRPSLKGTCPFY